MKSLPTIQASTAPLLEIADVGAMQNEVRALAVERNAVILAHNYQRPRVQTSRTWWATRSGFLPPGGRHRRGRDRVLRRAASWRRRRRSCRRQDGADPGPRRRLLPFRTRSPRPLRAWKARRRADPLMYVSHLGRGEGRDGSTAAPCPTPSRSSSTSSASTATTPRCCSAPTCGWVRTSRTDGRDIRVPWDGECHVHAGIRPADINALRASEPQRTSSIDPEVRLFTTQVMEYACALR